MPTTRIPASLSVLAAFGWCAAAAPLQPPAALGPVPLTFESCPGCYQPETRYLGRAAGRTLIFDSHGGVSVVNGSRRPQPLLRLRGANASPAIAASQPLPGKSHYLLGNDPRRWRLNVPQYGRVEYRQVYSGISLAYYAGTGGFEYDFLVAPGASPESIRIAFPGAASIRIDAATGDLLVEAGARLRHHRPHVYQRSGGVELPVSARYALPRPGEVGFELGPYDHSQPLVIDPVLSYSTLLGGSSDEQAYAIAVDSHGCAYIAGETWSPNFPATVPRTGVRGERDVFVTKLDAAGASPVYSAIIGGSSRDAARGVAVDSAGNAYVAGFTYSANFPTTSGALQRTPAGQVEAFVLKLDPTGAQLLYSTYLGGSVSDFATAIAVDASGEAYVAGYTSSFNFPVTAAAARSTFAGGLYDAFVARLNSSGSALSYSTYLGGSGNDLANAIAVDGQGNSYVTGQTDSGNFPMLSAAQSAPGGSGDAFVARFDHAGALVYSTYLGGTGPDYGAAIAVDSGGYAYVAGTTASVNFPVTSGAYQPTNRGGYDAFVAKLGPSGGPLVFSTFLGGGASEEARGVAVDSSGRVYVTGWTASQDFPVSSATPPFSGTSDVFLTCLNNQGSALNSSTYLGGGGADVALGIGLDPSSQIYIAGYTASAEFPVTTAALQPALAGGMDAFVAKFSIINRPPSFSLSPQSGSGTTQTFQAVYSDPDGAGDLNVVQLLVNSGLNGANGCYLLYNPSLALLTLANDAGNGSAGIAALGSPGQLANSRCAVDLAASTASAVGTDLTLRLALSFTPAFAGAKNVYLWAGDKRGGVAGWQAMGTWTATGNRPPFFSLLSPQSGRGSTQTFRVVYSDPDGAGDLSVVQLLVNNGLSGAYGCYLLYDASSARLTLANDAGNGSAGIAALGSPGQLANSRCAVNLAASSASAVGTDLTLQLALSFTAAFFGPKTIYLWAGDKRGGVAGWLALGSWTVGDNHPPFFSLLSPQSGSGTSQTFRVVYSDPDGASDLNLVQMLINNGLSGAYGCYLLYDPPSARLTLANDAGNGSAGTAALGSPGQLANSRCAVNLAASSASAVGTDLTLQLALSFTAAFSGPKAIYLWAGDKQGAVAGWTTAGTWTVP